MTTGSYKSFIGIYNIRLNERSVNFKVAIF